MTGIAVLIMLAAVVIIWGGLAVSITGQDAPMRTVFYQDHSHLTPGLHTRMTTYRTIVMVEVARDEE